MWLGIPSVKTSSGRRLSQTTWFVLVAWKKAIEMRAWVVRFVLQFESCHLISFPNRLRRSDGHRWRRCKNYHRNCQLRQQSRLFIRRSLWLHPSRQVPKLDFKTDRHPHQKLKSSKHYLVVIDGRDWITNHLKRLLISIKLNGKHFLTSFLLFK